MQEMNKKVIRLTFDEEADHEGKYVSVHSLLQGSQCVITQTQIQTGVRGDNFWNKCKNWIWIFEDVEI